MGEDRGRKDEELCLYEKFHASGECLTGIEQKKDCFSHGDLVVRL